MGLRAICKFTDWLVRLRKVYDPKCISQSVYGVNLHALLLKFNLYTINVYYFMFNNFYISHQDYVF